jgi:hypothetical protein
MNEASSTKFSSPRDKLVITVATVSTVRTTPGPINLVMFLFHLPEHRETVSFCFRIFPMQKQPCIIRLIVLLHIKMPVKRKYRLKLLKKGVGYSGDPFGISIAKNFLVGGGFKNRKSVSSDLLRQTLFTCSGSIRFGIVPADRCSKISPTDSPGIYFIVTVARE